MTKVPRIHLRSSLRAEPLEKNHRTVSIATIRYVRGHGIFWRVVQRKSIKEGYTKLTLRDFLQ